jgi:hypothetical protein
MVACTGESPISPLMPAAPDDETWWHRNSAGEERAERDLRHDPQFGPAHAAC